MMTHARPLTLLTLGSALLFLTTAVAQADPPPSPPPANSASDHSPADPKDGRHDFDFWVGEWRVHHRRLKERLAGSHEWTEFEGTSSVRLILDGQGAVDDNRLDMPGNPFRSVGLRAYDPKTGQWSIWWLDTRSPAADLDPAVKGRFEHGVGTFYADDTFKGKPIRVRFTWSHITPTSAHGEQAFSVDGGKTWEPNWLMDWQRVP